MSDRPKAEPMSDARAVRPPGRLRSAWSVLLGERLVPDQIRWEWAEYQHQFNDLLQRYSATLARAAKAEKKRLGALHDVLDGERPPSRQPLPEFPDHKSELRHRAAQLRGLRLTPSSNAQPEPQKEDAP